jgi:hypothetical protein
MNPPFVVTLCLDEAVGGDNDGRDYDDDHDDDHLTYG